MKLQTRKPKGYDPILVVASVIPQRNLLIWATLSRFYTTCYQEHLPPRPDGTPWPPNGKANEFLDFIEHELMLLYSKGMAYQ